MKIKHALMALGLVAAVALSGCYSRGQLVAQKQAGWDAGYSESQVECQDEKRAFAAEILRLRREMAAKDDRLRRFNQLDKDGALRSVPVQKEPPLSTGKESWQK